MSSDASPTITLSLEEARRAVLACQGLYPPRTGQGKAGVRSFLEEVRSIQFDPINVVGRNPDLVLQSRVQDYSPDLLDELLYQDRDLIDIWDKMASLGLKEDWPYFARRRGRMEGIFGVPADVVMTLAPQVLDQIRQKGPQCSLDYQLEEKTDWAWGPTRVTRASLEGLFKMGQLGIHHRVNNRRYFDLIENLLHEEFLQTPDPNHSLEEYQRWHVLRRVGGLGLAHPNAGEQWGGILGVKTARRRKILEELAEAGDLLRIEVESLPEDVFYLRSEDASKLEAAGQGRVPWKAALIAPLDNLLWDRKSVRRLFDFDYVWEVYKPAQKRIYGYYVLPILYGDRLIGRLDPSFDKGTGLLTINDWWWEPGVELDRELAAALQDCLVDFMAYLSAEDLRCPKTVICKSGLDWLEDL